MGKSIFYSWQSNIKENRNFIMKCINKAIGKLNGQETYQIYEIQRDTCGDSGSPDIKERVFSKIDKSDYFIADVTIINSNVEGKKTPNMEYDDEKATSNYAEFCFVVNFIDDTYSYNEYKNHDCSVSFEFNEILKQINFQDYKVYSAFDISPGYSPSGKNRAYGDLVDVIMNAL